MDTLLQHITKYASPSVSCGFNPCFNGYTTSTQEKTMKLAGKFCFNPCFNGYTTSTQEKTMKLAGKFCFNPCFNGYTTSTRDGWTD